MEVGRNHRRDNNDVFAGFGSEKRRKALDWGLVARDVISDGIKYSSY